ncbi:hypothetical protein HBH98_108780 [Parastagonospora nodorum]|nr:hypothetical protein HBH98_108780 [Parastagonospora nodorum]KAH4376853.1 hypothetical protein HBH97_114410 [Parastagonospora nodorum]KAH4396955.1 hypothetical protein HBH99_116090 [Parastagonospora nodorum]KAH5144895.1 hypothetical protein HBH70_055850 [Parastagonospora nodorum]KAH5570962.1 hypothetical protein HBI25_034810 [Parastagonospora nodorum]
MNNLISSASSPRPGWLGQFMKQVRTQSSSPPASSSTPSDDIPDTPPKPAFSTTSSSSSVPNEDNDLSNLRAQNACLQTRCSELTTQSHLNQAILHQCTSDLFVKDAEIKRLKAHISALQSSLEDQKASCLRLQAMGCSPADPAHELDLLLRIETLEGENVALKDKLAVQKNRMKSRVKEYADEANDLSTQLRRAEQFARTYAQHLRRSETTCQSLSAEHAHMARELHLEHSANKELQNALLQRSSHARHVAVLTTQLEKAQACASARANLITKLTQQSEEGLKVEKGERAKYTDKITFLHEENERDRRRFEAKLTARDKRIRGLEIELRSPAAAPHPDSLKVRALQDRLAGAELALEEDFARRGRGMQVEADDAARERVRELEGEVRALKGSWRGKKGKGVRREDSVVMGDGDRGEEY